MDRTATQMFCSNCAPIPSTTRISDPKSNTESAPLTAMPCPMSSTTSSTARILAKVMPTKRERVTWIPVPTAPSTETRLNPTLAALSTRNATPRMARNTTD